MSGAIDQAHAGHCAQGEEAAAIDDLAQTITGLAAIGGAPALTPPARISALSGALLWYARQHGVTNQRLLDGFATFLAVNPEPAPEEGADNVD